MMGDPKSLEYLLLVIERASPGAQGMWAHRQLKENLDMLWKFLNSGRYKGEPRQIANAMAGVPKIMWRTSLDVGTKHPSTLAVLY